MGVNCASLILIWMASHIRQQWTVFGYRAICVHCTFTSFNLHHVNMTDFSPNWHWNQRSPQCRMQAGLSLDTETVISIVNEYFLKLNRHWAGV